MYTIEEEKMYTIEDFFIFFIKVIIYSTKKSLTSLCQSKQVIKQ